MTSEAKTVPDKVERHVVLHYARSDLETAILDALIASGKDPDHLQPSDLAPVDEFHTAGHQATVELAAQVDFLPACMSSTSAAASAARRDSSRRSVVAT